MHEFEDIPARTEAEADFQRALTRFRHVRYIPTPASTVLTPAETHVIMGIGHFADADCSPRPRDIGRMLQLSASALSQTLGSLEKKGYITRERSGQDARQVALGLTQEGRRFVDSEISRFRNTMREMRDYLGEDDLREFARLLNKVDAFYEEQVAAGKMERHPAHGCHPAACADRPGKEA
ncbi:MAG: MarR family winged helix-turn-helix transcriptional regulator [Coriobacteriia bacterium]|nr:MarR family winged helix-turn-helix transcriptional regulator [Coriobacteriia bacterium]